MSAHVVACAIREPAATSRAADLATASAYMHPMADGHPTKHIVGPAANAAWAWKLAHSGDPDLFMAEIRRTPKLASREVRDVLQHMPARTTGTNRLDRILYELDAGIRHRRLGPGV